LRGWSRVSPEQPIFSAIEWIADHCEVHVPGGVAEGKCDRGEKWRVRQAERDQGVRPGATTDERERIKALERESRELRKANEILRKASAYFAQAELDRRFKR